MRLRRSIVIAVLAAGGVAHADRAPVAVLWMGDASTLAEGARVTEDVNNALRHSRTARPLDSAEDRRLLVEGGPVTRAAALQASAEAAFVKLKVSDAARDDEAAEQLLLAEVPFAETQRRLATVERTLLACYDQLGRADDAARAAERLSWTAGSNEDVKALLDKHLHTRAWQPSYPPVRIVSEPAGAQVYRNLLPVGVTPLEVPGGDPAVDAVDLELPGFRRAHQALERTGGTISVTLLKEDRLGALVDQVRSKAPDAPPAEVAALGRRLGVSRVLALGPDGAKKLLARWLDVAAKKWTDATIRVDSSGTPAMERLSGYVSPPPPSGVAPAGGPMVVAATRTDTPPSRGRWGAWGKWYTWVAAGGVLLLVGGLLIAQHVGDDSLKVSVSH